MSAWANKAKLAQITSPNQNENQIQYQNQNQNVTHQSSLAPSPSQSPNPSSQTSKSPKPLQSLFAASTKLSNQSKPTTQKRPHSSQTNLKPRQSSQSQQSHHSNQSSQPASQTSQSASLAQQSLSHSTSRPNPTQALPQPRPSSQADFSDTLNRIQQGSQLKVTTSLSETITGRAYCYERSLNLLLIQLDQTAQRESHDYSIINTNHLTSIEISEAPLAQLDHLQSPNHGASIAREDKAVQDRLIESQKIAPFTTPQSNDYTVELAQRIFDACSKTLPCSWSNQIIVVMNSIQIHPPYSVNNVVGNNKSQVSRVSKIVETEWRRIKQETSNS